MFHNWSMSSNQIYSPTSFSCCISRGSSTLTSHLQMASAISIDSNISIILATEVDLSDGVLEPGLLFSEASYTPCFRLTHG